MISCSSEEIAGVDSAFLIIQSSLLGTKATYEDLQLSFSFTGDYSALTPSFACCYVTDRKSAGEVVHYYWTLCIKFTSLTVCAFVFLYLFFIFYSLALQK